MDAWIWQLMTGVASVQLATLLLVVLPMLVVAMGIALTVLICAWLVLTLFDGIYWAWTGDWPMQYEDVDGVDELNRLFSTPHSTRS